MQKCIKILLFHIYMKLNMFRATTSTNYTSNNLPRMKNQRLPVQFYAPDDGRLSPETCWASYKFGIIKVWYTVASCWIFLYKLHLHLKWALPLVTLVHFWMFWILRPFWLNILLQHTTLMLRPSYPLDISFLLHWQNAPPVLISMHRSKMAMDCERHSVRP